MIDPKTQVELAEWISTDVIAVAILDTLEDSRLDPSLENAKEVWLDFLGTDLHDSLSSSVDAIAQGEPIKDLPDPEIAPLLCPEEDIGNA